MSIESSIQNVGEYFSAHYMADNKGFAKDISDQVKLWKEQKSQAAPRQLQSLGEDFFAAKSKALDYPQPELRNKAGEKYLDSWHPKLLTALGYQPEPIAIELASEKKQIPALLRLYRHSQPWLAILEAPFCLSSGDLVEEVLETFVEPFPTKEGNQTIEGLPTLIDEWEKAIAQLFKQEDRPRWAMLLAGSKIYLFDAHTYTQGRYLYIDLDTAYSSKDSKTFDAIAALLSHDSLAPETESDEVLHEKLREGSLKSTHGVSEQLQGAVREAIELIANGWIEARRNKRQGFRKLSEQEEPLADGTRDITAEQLKHDALVYVYRILFCLYAEARGGELGVLPITDDIYRMGYSLEALRDLADMGEPGTQSDEGTYYAEHLNRLFQLVHDGFHPEGKADEVKAEQARQEQHEMPKDQIDLFSNDVPKQLELDKSSGSSLGQKQIDTGYASTFVIQPLTATLFALNATPLLNRVLLSNCILHQVIRRLSLGTGSKGKQIGRINYAELGIVQLGSVYEGLLSYKGFFAKEDLLQVVQAGKSKTVKGKKQVPIVYDDAVDPKKPSWFVPVSRLDEFNEGEVVIEKRTKQARIYRMGEFILHLNGVDRVNSASYYTPEVLTRALVKEALKERLKDFGPEQADEILTLKICEPAMGSAAFLVEAIDQLSRHYLTLKQEQLEKSIDPTAFEGELGRVKHYIAVHNVYGVDLNPTAVELGALSLWLSSIHSLKIKTGENGAPDIYRPGQTPWFGLRLRAGNSLIGARRAVWSYDQLTMGKHFGKNAEAPRQIKPGESRKDNEIYHFLVWDEDMAPAARDKLMKSYWNDECEAINDWQKQQVKQKWKPEELAKAKTICKRIDGLWQDYAQQRVKGLEQTQCTATVWPIPSGSLKALQIGPTLEFQEQQKINLEAQSGAFQRLKLLMDSWCSFYFWPLQESDNLPTRETWLISAESLMSANSLSNAQSIEESWFQIAHTTDAIQNFHHWELIFTEILGPEFNGQEIKPKGFDLMFGNPPWMKVTWNDAPLLSEYEPLLGVSDAKSAKYNSERPKLLIDEYRKLNYRDAFLQGEGLGVFLNDKTIYPSLAGVQTNLYKNFIERSWDLLKTKGIAGLLHPEGVFDDPNGGNFRGQYYHRLTAHFQLKNELILFADVHHVMAFSINVYQGATSEINFKSIFNLFSPGTIEQCYQTEQKNLPIPGIKTNNGKWETLGHPERLITITEKELILFAKLFEDVELTAIQSRLPQVHSQPLLNVLEKFAQAPKRLGDLKGQYFATVMFDETYAQRDGIITREESPSYQPQSTDEWVISGPHFYVGSPFNKTPRSSCTANGHYDQIDLTEISENYLPRAVYRPGDKEGNLENFYVTIPEWPKPQKPIQDENDQWQPGFWPVADNEISAYEILLGEPLKRYGIDQNQAGAKTARQFGYFRQWQGDVAEAVRWLLYNNNQRNTDDFNVRFGDIRIRQKEPENDELNFLPLPFTARERLGVRRLCQAANERTLIGALCPAGATAINAVLLTAFLKEQHLLEFTTFSSSILADFIVKVSGRGNIYESNLRQLPILEGEAISLATQITKSLQRIYNIRSPGANYRTDYERRKAFLNIDVLCAIQLGISVNELIQIYSIQFPVMKNYEEVDQYDLKGCRLPNTSRKDAGAKELREALKKIDAISPVTVSWKIDNGNQTITKTFYPPFKHVDRIEDYKTAYRVFSERLGLSDKQNQETNNANL